MSTATQAPTVQVTVGTFDAGYNRSNIFRNVLSVPLEDFTSFDPRLYTPSNRDWVNPEAHGGGGTPLIDATMEMIHLLDGLRSPDTVTTGLLLDESGSMGFNQDAVNAGVNDFLTNLKGIPATEGGRVLCVIFTDGEENASTKVSAETLRSAVAERENDGWTFLFMGANMDAWDEGSRSTGISGGITGQSVNFVSTPTGTSSAFGEMKRRSASYLAGQGDYEVYASAMGNNASVAEDGTIKKDTKHTPPQSPYSNTADGLDSVKKTL